MLLGISSQVARGHALPLAKVAPSAGECRACLLFLFLVPPRAAARQPAGHETDITSWRVSDPLLT
jgi:hypothetical protein